MRLDQRTADAGARNIGHVAEQDWRAGEAFEGLDHGNEDEQNVQAKQTRGADRHGRGASQYGGGVHF